MATSNYKFTILDSSGVATATTTDMSDMFARKELFLDSGLWTWGYNAYGQLGDGTRTSKSSPVQIGSLTTWKSVAGGIYNSYFIKTDGTMWGCGLSGSTYAVGDGDTTDRSSPVQIGSLTVWNQVAAGYYFGLAVGQNGTLWGWGKNDEGGLGLGDSSTKYSPVQIGSLTNWKQVACGYRHTLAVKTNGTLWSWGSNNSGVGMTNNDTRVSSPVQVGSLTNWASVATGRKNSFAIKTDGTLWSCGYGYSGINGDGTRTNRSSPVQIGLLTDWKQVSCGGQSYYAHAIAVKTDGTLWAWGYNASGQLGDGTRTDKSSPVQVGALTDWKQVACGYDHSTCVKTDGTLWSWGYNASGQQGQGNITDRSSPVQVGALTNWKSVSAGGVFTLGIQSTDLQ